MSRSLFVVSTEDYYDQKPEIRVLAPPIEEVAEDKASEETRAMGLLIEYYPNGLLFQLSRGFKSPIYVTNAELNKTGLMSDAFHVRTYITDGKETLGVYELIRYAGSENPIIRYEGKHPLHTHPISVWGVHDRKEFIMESPRNNIDVFKER